MCKRTSFQYKVVRVPEDDFYTAAAQQGDPMGTYEDDSHSTTRVWGGYNYALSFFDCANLNLVAFRAVFEPFSPKHAPGVPGFGHRNR